MDRELGADVVADLARRAALGVLLAPRTRRNRALRVVARDPAHDRAIDGAARADLDQAEARGQRQIVARDGVVELDAQRRGALPQPDAEAVAAGDLDAGRVELVQQAVAHQVADPAGQAWHLDRRELLAHRRPARRPPA